jgi:hypothetical protein
MSELTERLDTPQSHSQSEKISDTRETKLTFADENVFGLPSKQQLISYSKAIDDYYYKRDG